MSTLYVKASEIKKGDCANLCGTITEVVMVSERFGMKRLQGNNVVMWCNPSDHVEVMQTNNYAELIAELK